MNIELQKSRTGDWLSWQPVFCPLDYKIRWRHSEEDKEVEDRGHKHFQKIIGKVPEDYILEKPREECISGRRYSI